MRVTLVYKTSKLDLTIPKKWAKGQVRQLVEHYVSSPTGKRLGLNQSSWEDIYLEASGQSISQDAVLHLSLRDGDVVQVRRQQHEDATLAAAAAAAEGESPRPSVRLKSSIAKHATQKAEDFASAHDDCEWRGVRFGCYVVCDGHGGQQAAQSAKQRLLPTLLAKLDERAGDSDPASALARELPAAMVASFEAVDAGVDGTSGTTATMVLVLPGAVAAAAAGADLVDSDDEDVEPRRELGDAAQLAALAGEAALVVCANVGDSLAFVDDARAGKTVRLLSHDHRLERNSSEQQRCRNAGGRVEREDPSDAKKPLRLWPGGLMMSRVLGDFDAPQALPAPEIRACLIFDGRARVVVASDGLWDELSGRAAFKAAAPKQPAAAAQLLVTEARKRAARRKEGADDIVAVVVDVDVSSRGSCGGKSSDDERSSVVRLWDAPARLAGAALDAAIVDARRRKVAAVARGAGVDALEWCGLATDPATFFRAHKVAGVGGFGRVILCSHRLTGDPIAIKVMTKAALRRKRHERRARVERDSLVSLSSRDNSGLVSSLSCAWQNEAAVYLAMPYIGGGDLATALEEFGRLPPANVAFYAAELLCALSFAHSRGVLHRDVKPENLLLDTDGHAVLIDLGLARPAPRPELGADDLARTRCGTDEYWSPEMVRKEAYSTATDVWSAAVLVYELLAGKPPFLPDQLTAHKKKHHKQKKDAPLVSSIHEAVLHKALKFHPPEAFSACAVDLLRRALDRDRTQRLGVSRLDGLSADIASIRRHAWWRSTAPTADLGDLDDDDAWWSALERRRIPPPAPVWAPPRRSDDDDATTTSALRDANEARAYLRPSEPADDRLAPSSPASSATHAPAAAGFRDIVAAEKSRHRTRDPYDGFEHASPADACWSLPAPRGRPVEPIESASAPSCEAVRFSSVLAAQAAGRGVLARLRARSLRRAANRVSRFARTALARRRAAARARAVPAIVRALDRAARRVAKLAYLKWCRFSTRVASARAAQQRRRDKEIAERADRPEKKPDSLDQHRKPRGGSRGRGASRGRGRGRWQDDRNGKRQPFEHQDRRPDRPSRPDVAAVDAPPDGPPRYVNGDDPGPEDSCKRPPRRSKTADQDAALRYANGDDPGPPPTRSSAKDATKPPRRSKTPNNQDPHSRHDNFDAPKPPQRPKTPEQAPPTPPTTGDRANKSRRPRTTDTLRDKTPPAPANNNKNHRKPAANDPKRSPPQATATSEGGLQAAKSAAERETTNGHHSSRRLPRVEQPRRNNQGSDQPREPPVEATPQSRPTTRDPPAFRGRGRGRGGGRSWSRGRGTPRASGPTVPKTSTVAQS